MKKENITKIYGENLKRYRINNDLTQEQAAQITKLEEKYISQIERGVRTGTIMTMLKFCKGYNISPNDLFSGIVNETKNKNELDLLVQKISKLNRRDKHLITHLIDTMLDIEK